MKIKGSVKKSKSSKVSLEGKPRRASFSQVHFFVFLPDFWLVSWFNVKLKSVTTQQKLHLRQYHNIVTLGRIVE